MTKQTDIDYLLSLHDYHGTYKSRNHFGTVAYQNYMQSLSPFIKAFYEVYELLEKERKENAENKREREHYYTRYHEVAEIACQAQKAFEQMGLKSSSYKQ